MSAEIFDLAVIGGGLTGAAVARDAAGRGLSVVLAEALDLGEGASSATGGVVQGPLDNLHRFRLAKLRRDAAESAILLHSAPHLVRAVAFVLPRHPRLLRRWRDRLGLITLDWLAGSGRKPGRSRRLGDADCRRVMSPDFAVAYSVTDCIADDSRLAVLNAVNARFRGASIRPRVRCSVAERESGRWRLSLESTVSGSPYHVEARALVNAGGAAVADVNDHVIHTGQRIAVRLLKRSYLAVRRSLPEGEAYAMPRGDGTIVYAVPIAAGLTLLGPHAVPYAGHDATLAIDPAAVSDLVDTGNRYFGTPLGTDDVVSGLTALWAYPARAAWGDWTAEVDQPAGAAPLVSIVGATLATHRRAAEAAVSAIAGRFPKARPAWTASAALPGGAFPAGGVAELARALAAAYRFIPLPHAQRLAGAYGTRAHEILIGCRSPADLGRRFGADLTEVEVNYLRREEWAETAADILWRRTKLGLQMSAGEASALDAWLKRNRGTAAGPVMP